MSLYTTEAVIIGIKNQGEADKAVTLLSPDRGRIRATAFGCRRIKSPMAGALQLFNQVEVQINEGERWDTIRQCSLPHAFRNLSEDFQSMAYGSFVAELASNLSIENFPQVEMYNRLLEIFGAFGSRNPRIAALAAGYQLLEFSGMQLSYEHCICCNDELAGDGFFSFELGGVVCQNCQGKVQERLWDYPEALREFIVQLLQLSWQERPACKVNGKTLMAAEGLLLGYLRHIIDKPLQSLNFIQQLG